MDRGGIEPPSVQCECTVLPLYYRPERNLSHNFNTELEIDYELVASFKRKDCAGVLAEQQANFAPAKYVAVFRLETTTSSNSLSPDKS